MDSLQISWSFGHQAVLHELHSIQVSLHCGVKERCRNCMCLAISSCCGMTISSSWCLTYEATLGAMGTVGCIGIHFFQIHVTPLQEWTHNNCWTSADERASFRRQWLFIEKHAVSATWFSAKRSKENTTASHLIINALTHRCHVVRPHGTWCTSITPFCWNSINIQGMKANESDSNALPSVIAFPSVFDSYYLVTTGT